jgi:hypothetical protein
MIGTLEKTTGKRAVRTGEDELDPRNYAHDAASYYNAHVFARTGERFRPLDFVDGRTILVNRELLERRRENRHRIAGRVGERSMTSRRAA